MGWPDPICIIINIPVSKNVPCHIPKMLQYGFNPMLAPLWRHFWFLSGWVPMVPKSKASAWVNEIFVETGSAHVLV